MSTQLYPKKVWEIMNSSSRDVIDILLENRNLNSTKEKKDFFEPTDPMEITLQSLGISKLDTRKAIKRIKKAIDEKQKIIIYGDYDADGITATAIMWEAVHSIGVDVLPYIPDRFEEGYGINSETVEKLKSQNPNLKLIITVDNGIVALDAIEFAKKLGIDVIITDHHEPSKIKPKAFAIIHTKKIAGSGVAWIFARELTKKNIGLELTAIGIVADQMPLIGANRSFVKYGIEELKRTKRLGLLELLKQAAVKIEDIGTYEINYIIAPRINAMGRLSHGIESLRLLCTKDKNRARDLAQLVAKTNLERQEIVEKTVLKVRSEAEKLSDTVIFLSDESYHEGIIGLAAGRIVEEFYRPAIVISQGKTVSKGSARSISGFNIIDAIRLHQELLVAHGGHTMAAGFTILNSKLDEFRERITKTANEILTKELLTRKLKIDSRLSFKNINWEMVAKLKEFEPSGQGNPTPTFVSEKVEVVDIRVLGKEKNHLKLKLKNADKFFDAIGFGIAPLAVATGLKKGDLIDIVYSLEENIWNNVRSLQLKLRDLRIHE